jgi:hypothetical protein
MAETAIRKNTDGWRRERRDSIWTRNGKLGVPRLEDLNIIYGIIDSIINFTF